MESGQGDRAIRKVVGNQKGFTLIEIIVVIVLLGILAATAIPRFGDMQTDARIASVNGLAGALRGASAIVHSRALLDGQTGSTGADTVTLEGATSVSTIYSYARNSSIDEALVSYDGFTLTAGVDATSEAIFTLQAGCTVSYEEAAAANGTPTITVATGGC
ncbi:MAG: pilus assembly FimT family protein [Thermodesulfobacteriota bacterium]